MSKPIISIITPAYNAEKYIAEAIESVQKQSFKYYEHIIIDDGSTDATSSIVKKYADDDKRIICIKQKNQGPSAARNRGIDQAQGEYVAFLDADDMYAPDTLRILAVKSEETGADIVYYNFVYYYGSDPGDSVSHRIEISEGEMYTKESLSKKLFNVFPILTCNKLIKQEVLARDKVRFNTKYLRNEDVDFSIRATLAADTYACVDYVGYYYRIGNSNSETATNFKHPTQLLQILIDLNQLIKSKYSTLKQSFDNYAINQTIGSVNMQEAYPEVQEEVFSFAADQVVPELDLQEIQQNYLYQPELFESFVAIRDKNYTEMLRSRIKILSSHTAWLEESKREFEKTVYDLQIDHASKEKLVNDLTHKLDEIYQSASWRATKPLRGIGKIVRGD